MGDYGQEQEEKERWKQKNTVDKGSYEYIFKTSPVSGRNTKNLAQILALLDLAGHQLGWDIEKKNSKGEITRRPFIPSQLLIAYQAGIDGKPHDDLVKVAELDEYIQKKALMRKAQMMQDNTLMT